MTITLIATCMIRGKPEKATVTLGPIPNTFGIPYGATLLRKPTTRQMRKKLKTIAKQESFV